MVRFSLVDRTKDGLQIRHLTLWWRRGGSGNNLFCQYIIISNDWFEQRRCCVFSHYVLVLLFIILAFCSDVKSGESVILCLNLIDGAAAENVLVDVTWSFFLSAPWRPASICCTSDAVCVSVATLWMWRTGFFFFWKETFCSSLLSTATYWEAPETKSQILSFTLEDT